jgi:short-subunit dehydrogenase
MDAASAVIPPMIEQGGGYLLNTASAADWLSINYKNEGVGVSVFCPQAVRTNILAPKAMKAAKAAVKKIHIPRSQPIFDTKLTIMNVG